MQDGSPSPTCPHGAHRQHEEAIWTARTLLVSTGPSSRSSIGVQLSTIA